MTKPVVRIFGIPMDLGQNRRGVDMGPSAVRYTELQERLERLGYVVYDEGNIPVSQAEELADDANNAHFLPEVAHVCRQTYQRISESLQDDEYAIFVGGDHSISIGTIPAIATGHSVGVIWVDAHTDMNTPETSPSGNIHGMSVAALLGYGPDELTKIAGDTPTLQPEQVAMVGIRDVDERERQAVIASGLHVYTMRDVDELGLSEVARRILAHFAHLDHIHVSLDLDSCDPRIAPGVGTPVNGGFNYREAHLLMEILADSGKVRTVDIVEINPILDDQNQTANIAVELVASLFGQRIL